MKAGLSLARPTKTTGTALLQKTVPHGARCPRIEPCPTQRADGRAAPPARRSGPERAAQTRPSGSRPGTFGPLTHRCERKPIQRPIRKKQALAPAFTPALSGRQPAGDAFAGGETERGAVSGLFFAPFHTAFPSVRSDREARRESPRRTGSRNADKIQAIPEHTTARFRKSDVSSAHPLFGFRTDLRGGLFAFAPNAAFAASPDGPVGKPDGKGPAPPVLSPTPTRHSLRSSAARIRQNRSMPGCGHRRKRRARFPIQNFPLSSCPQRVPHCCPSRRTARRVSPSCRATFPIQAVFPRPAPFLDEKVRKKASPHARSGEAEIARATDAPDGAPAHRSRCFPARRGLIFRKKS